MGLFGKLKFFLLLNKNSFLASIQFISFASNKSSGEESDLLEMLVSANNEGSKMTDEELIHNVNTFFIAGHETTSSSTKKKILKIFGQSLSSGRKFFYFAFTLENCSAIN